MVELVWRQADYWKTVYRRTWRGSVFSSFLLPLLYLAAMGIGLGSYVNSRSGPGALGGLTYLEYIAPGLLAITAMQAAVGESTWPVMSMLKWDKVYQAMLATPLRVRDVLAAHLGFVAFRLATTCAVFLVVVVAFGAVPSPAGAVPALVVAVVVGMAHASPTFAFAAWLKTESGLSLLFRLGVIPMTLFSGAFFPIHQLPQPVQWLAWLMPVWHGVETERGLTTGDVSWPAMLGHVCYLLAWLVAGWWLALRAFQRKLAD